MLQDLLEKFKAYIVSDYLHYAWWLIIAGYLFSYAIAYALARAGNAEKTILYRCCFAWAIALLIHALAATGFTIKWIFDYGYFPSFWTYFPWYLGMIAFDGYVIISGLTSTRRFASYEQ